MTFADADSVLFVANCRHDELVGMVDSCKEVHHYFAMGIAEHTRAVVYLLGTVVVVDRALHIVE